MESKYNITTPENVAPEIFARLKDLISSCFPHDRYVAVTFDHHILRDIAPHLYRTKKEANKPIACLFWNGTEEKCLADLLHVYINALTDARVRVVATVCPAENCFIKVVEHMTQIQDIMTHNSPITFSTRQAKDIVHIFDPPKLLKDMRDHYIQYVVSFKINRVQRTTSWNDIESLYDLVLTDVDLDNYERIIFPSDEDSLCTKYAAKLFSKTFSLELLKLAKNSDQHWENFSSAAELCMFFNNVFDSFNANFCAYNSCVLRRPVTKESVHIQGWDLALDVLDSMYFLLSDFLAKYVKDDGQLTSVKQSSNSSKKKSKKLRKKNKDDPKVEQSTSKTNNVEAVENFINLGLQEIVNKKETKNTEISASGLTEGNGSEYYINDKKVDGVKLDIIHYWKLNIMGIKALVETLFKRHFQRISTKIFNVDNVHAFFNAIKIMNKGKASTQTHEHLYFSIMDDLITTWCMAPSATYSLVHYESMTVFSTTNTITTTTAANISTSTTTSTKQSISNIREFNGSAERSC